MIKFYNGVKMKNDVKLKGKPPLVGDTIILSVKLSKHFCELFGFVEKTFYEIFGSTKIRNTVARYPASPRCNINYLYIYCDKIQPSPFGGQLVKDVVPLQTAKNPISSIYRFFR